MATSSFRFQFVFFLSPAPSSYLNTCTYTPFARFFSPSLSPAASLFSLPQAVNGINWGRMFLAFLWILPLVIWMTSLFLSFPFRVTSAALQGSDGCLGRSAVNRNQSLTECVLEYQWKLPHSVGCRGRAPLLTPWHWAVNWGKVEKEMCRVEWWRRAHVYVCVCVCVCRDMQRRQLKKKVCQCQHDSWNYLFMFLSALITEAIICFRRAVATPAACLNKIYLNWLDNKTEREWGCYAAQLRQLRIYKHHCLWINWPLLWGACN